MKKNNKLELIDPSNIKINESVVTSGVNVRNEKIRVQLTDEEIKYLDIRKKIELDIIQKYDKINIIPRKECWYLIDSKWLNQWTKYVLSTSISTNDDDDNDDEVEEVDPPGLLTTEHLHDEHGKLLLNLQPNLDYRGVTPLVYYIFTELYGRAKVDKTSPELTRYQCDIYKIPVTTVDMLKIRYVWHVSRVEYMLPMLLIR